jgi:hypothetical protein
VNEAARSSALHHAVFNDGDWDVEELRKEPRRDTKEAWSEERANAQA